MVSQSKEALWGFVLFPQCALSLSEIMARSAVLTSGVPNFFLGLLHGGMGTFLKP